MAGSLDTTNLTRRAIVTGIPAAAIGIGSLAAAVAIPIAATAETVAALDPVFLALENHKAACNLLNDVCPRIDSMVNSNITEEDQAAYDEASDAELEALQDLIDTRPTSIAGLRAYLSHFSRVLFYFDSTAQELIDGLLQSPVLAI